MRAVPRLCVWCPDICLTTEEKSTEQTSVRVGEECQLGTTQRVDMAAFEFSRREGFKLYTFLSSAPIYLEQHCFVWSSPGFTHLSFWKQQY